MVPVGVPLPLRLPAGVRETERVPVGEAVPAADLLGVRETDRDRVDAGDPVRVTVAAGVPLRVASGLRLGVTAAVFDLDAVRVSDAVGLDEATHVHTGADE